MNTENTIQNSMCEISFKVLKTVTAKKTLLTTRKIQMIYIVRKKGLKMLILTGQINDKRNKGRQLDRFEQMDDGTGITKRLYVLLEGRKGRKSWRAMISHARKVYSTVRRI